MQDQDSVCGSKKKRLWLRIVFATDAPLER